MIIRDAVHGDLEFSRDEEAIIRTKEFQRLHYVRQLGTCWQVYPSATHTRFEHSLGVCFLTKKIINNLKYFRGVKFPKEGENLLPVAALLHDICHVPFGHVLEDDLNLFSDHDSRSRYEAVLSTGEISKALSRSVKQFVIDVLSKRPQDLPCPHYSEIIKNTISADLFDYLYRDIHYTGIRRQFDEERIMRYFNIGRKNRKEHFFIDICEGKVKCPDVITEMEGLLRIRYTLAERAYYYHTKLAADAMVGKAIGESSLPVEFFQARGDDEVILHLCVDKKVGKTASILARAYRERKLFRTAYMIDVDSIEDEGKAPADFSKSYTNRTACKRAEEEILKRFLRGKGIEYEDFVVFCPDWGMNRKIANTLVRDEKGDVKFVCKLPDSQEFREIPRKHERIWRFYVFCKRGKEEVVGKACKRHFGFKNKWDASS